MVSTLRAGLCAFVLTLAAVCPVDAQINCPPLVAPPPDVVTQVSVCAPLSNDGLAYNISRVRFYDNTTLYEVAARASDTDGVQAIFPIGAVTFTAGSHILKAQVSALRTAMCSGAALAGIPECAGHENQVISYQVWSSFWTTTLLVGDTPPPPPPPCSFTLGVPTTPIPAAGGQGQLTVQASDATCSWTLNNSATWLGLSATSGTGATMVTFIAGPNTSTSPRSATLVFASGSTNLYTVSQEGYTEPPPPPPPSDTTPPDITNIRWARSGNSSNYTLYAQTKAEDIADVYFYLDLREVGHMACCVGQNSFSTKATVYAPGSYVVRVVMIDLSGNRSEAIGPTPLKR